MEAWNLFRLFICVTPYFHCLRALVSSGYAGCFEDDVFPKGTWFTGVVNNGARCVRTCRASGYIFAATKSHYCICDMIYFGSSKRGNCVYKCPGFQNEICGGPDSISVYDIRLTDMKSTPTAQTDALLESTKSIDTFTEQTASDEAAVQTRIAAVQTTIAAEQRTIAAGQTTLAAAQTTIAPVQTIYRSTTPNSYMKKSSEITNWTLCFPAEIFTSILAGIIGIVSVVAGVIVLIRRKMRLQQDTNVKNSLYRSLKNSFPNRTVENDNDYLNASLESDLPRPAAANTDNYHLSELLHSGFPRSTAANAYEHVSEWLQSNGEGLNVVNADNEYVNEPLKSGRIVSVAVHDYVDTNYDELISQREDEHCYAPLIT